MSWDPIDIKKIIGGYYEQYYILNLETEEIDKFLEKHYVTKLS